MKQQRGIAEAEDLRFEEGKKTYLGLAHNLVSVKSTSHRLSHDLSQINSFVWDVAVSGTRKPALLYTLSALLLVEGAALAATTIYLVVEIFSAPIASVGSAVALAVLVAILAVAVCLVARATLAGRHGYAGQPSASRSFSCFSRTAS